MNTKKRGPRSVISIALVAILALGLLSLADFARVGAFEAEQPQQVSPAGGGAPLSGGEITELDPVSEETGEEPPTEPEPEPEPEEDLSPGYSLTLDVPAELALPLAAGDFDLAGIASATDETGGAVAVAVASDSGFDPNTPGTYIVEYLAVHPQDNSVTASAQCAVTVAAAEPDAAQAQEELEPAFVYDPMPEGPVSITEEMLRGGFPKWELAIPPEWVPEGYSLVECIDEESGKTYFQLVANPQPFLALYAAADIVVTSEDELLAALADSTYDTITLGNDISLTGPVEVNRAVTIDGGADKYALTFTMPAATIAIASQTAFEATFQNLTIAGTPTAADAAQYQGTTTLTGSATANFTNVDFTGCGGASGGALNLSGAGVSAQLTDCTFTDNRVSGNGGAVLAEGGAAITLNNCAVSSNQSGGNGGGICVVGANSSLSVSGGSIGDNAAINGGGIYCADGATLSLSGLSITGNTAYVDNKTANGKGGGIYSQGGINIAAGIEISGNKSLFGGGVYSEGPVTMTGGKVDGNSAYATTNTAGVPFGGGIYMAASGALSVTGGSVSNNTVDYAYSQARGGGIAVADGSTAEIGGSALLSGNTAVGGNGGALWAGDNCTITIFGGAKLTGNKSLYGGAIDAGDKANITVKDNAELSNNTAAAGSAICGDITFAEPAEANGTSYVYLKGGSISGNHAVAEQPGGDAYAAIFAYYVEVDGASITGNDVKGHMPAVNCYNFVMKSGKINDNKVLEMVSESYTKGTVTCSRFAMSGGEINNNSFTTAEQLINGGGVYIALRGDAAGAETVVMTGGTINGNSAYQGGGIDIYASPDTKNHVLRFAGGEISDNSAGNAGGGLAFWDEGANNKLSLSGTSFINNNAVGGGGFYFYSGSGTHDIAIDKGTFSDNTAVFGGGIYISPAAAVTSVTVTIGSGCVIKDNSAVLSGTSGGGGGGICVFGANGNATLTVNGASFSGNSAENYGGGIALAGTKGVIQNGATIADNTAAKTGGGIVLFSDGAELTVDGSAKPISITGNSAQSGGGAWVYDYSKATFDGVLFKDNSAPKGYYMENAAHITLYNNQVSNIQGLSEPFTQYAYNNFDIVYTSGTLLPTTYKISYDGAGYTGGTLPVGISADWKSTVDVATVEPTKEDYTFGGWRADFNQAVYRPGGSFTMPAKDVVLTAVWVKSSVPATPTTPATPVPTESAAAAPETGDNNRVFALTGLLLLSAAALAVAAKKRFSR